MAAPWVISRMRSGWLAITVAWSLVLTFAPMIWSVNPWLVGSCLAFGVFFNPIGSAGLSAYRVVITPDALQGRVQAATSFLAMVVMALAAPLGGALMALYGGAPAMAAAIALAVGAALLLTLSRSIRAVSKPAEWPRDASGEHLGQSVDGVAAGV